MGPQPVGVAGAACETGHVERVFGGEAQPLQRAAGLPLDNHVAVGTDVTFFDAPVLVGTHEDAVKELERYRQETRVTDVVLWMQLFDPKKVRRSMELFAKEVMPHFRD